MLLIVSMVLALAPLVGIGLLLWSDPALTVGNLFTTLILLTISGLFGMNVLLELRDRGLPLPLLKKRKPAAMAAAAAAGGGGKVLRMPSGALKEAGVIENVAYYESGVGYSNRCVVTLRNGKAPRLLVFKGDVREQFPLGRKVEVVYSGGEGGADLLERKLA